MAKRGGNREPFDHDELFGVLPPINSSQRIVQRDNHARRAMLIEAMRRRAQVDLLQFMRWVWWMPRPLMVGRHTRTLCARLTRAVDDWLEGRSTYIVTSMPFRHGKSDIVSRAFPAYFLGRCAAQEPDYIMSGYGTDLMRNFSKMVQSIMRSDAYQQLFPNVMPKGASANLENWQVDGSVGTFTAQGLGGAITGKGGHVIVLDDYCKNREEAESPTMREKTWASFKDDLMTRTNAPAAIVVVCATRWHTDDLIGRIRDEMKTNAEFPQFEFIEFPARKAGEYEYLFPELWSPAWYAAQRATLGSYSAAALLDCNPVGGDLSVFREDWFFTVDELPREDKVNLYMFIDSAYSQKEIADYTTIWVIGYGADMVHYAHDCVHDHLNPAEVRREVLRLHKRWRPHCVFWEKVGTMTDSFNMREFLAREGYNFPIIDLKHNDPKEHRITSLQPLFEAGRVCFPNHMTRISHDGREHDIVKEFFENEYRFYPNVKHDDMIDALADICDKQVIEMTTYPNANGRGGDLLEDYSHDVRDSLFAT